MFVILEGKTEGSYFTIYWKGRVMVQHETMDIFIAGEGNYYWSDKGGGLEERELLLVTLLF